jgi:hypothetical protein
MVSFLIYQANEKRGRVQLLFDAIRAAHAGHPIGCR